MYTKKIKTIIIQQRLLKLQFIVLQKAYFIRTV